MNSRRSALIGQAASSVAANGYHDAYSKRFDFGGGQRRIPAIGGGNYRGANKSPLREILRLTVIEGLGNLADPKEAAKAKRKSSCNVAL